MSALTSGSSVIISVSSAQGTVSRESPNLFPSHSLGFRSCLSHLMLICRRQGRAGEGSGFIALRHAIERNNEVTELDISQYLLWQRQGGRANLLLGTEHFWKSRGMHEASSRSGGQEACWAACPAFSCVCPLGKLRFLLMFHLRGG